MTPTTPPPNLSPADEQRLKEWYDWYARCQPEPMPVDELPALLRDVAEGRVGVDAAVTRARGMGGRRDK